eukprot:2989642-Rhodomonas_salina.1
MPSHVPCVRSLPRCRCTLTSFPRRAALTQSPSCSLSLVCLAVSVCLCRSLSRAARRYINLRLVTIYNQDTVNGETEDEQGTRTTRTDSTGSSPLPPCS